MARPAGARASGASRDPALWVTVAVLWALLALFVLYPLLCLLARVAMDGERLSPGAALAVLGDPNQLRALANSLLLAALVGVAGTALGFLFALTASRAGFGRGWLAVLDAVTLPDDGSGHVRLRGNAFYAIGGAAIRVADGGQKPEVSFNNFDSVGDAFCLGDTCFATGQAVNGSGAGGGNRDLASGFLAPGAFPGNFHLDPGSALVDAADPEDQVLRLDLDGTIRPADGDQDGTAVEDIGAFEVPPRPAGGRRGGDVLRPRPGAGRTADRSGTR